MASLGSVERRKSRQSILRQSRVRPFRGQFQFNLGLAPMLRCSQRRAQIESYALLTFYGILLKQSLEYANCFLIALDMNQCISVSFIEFLSRLRIFGQQVAVSRCDAFVQIAGGLILSR